MTLDRIDRRLLVCVQDDNRRTVRDLAAEVGISAPTCLLRMRRLSKEGIIRANAALVEPGKVGYSVMAYIEMMLERTSEAALQAFESRMTKNRHVMHCFEMSGSVDYVITVIARDLEEFSEFTRPHLAADRNVRTFRSQLVMRHVKRAHRLPL